MRFWERIEPAPLTFKGEEDEDRRVCTFSLIPRKGPYAGTEIPYYVIFEREENIPPDGLLWDFGDDTIDGFPDDQILTIKAAQDRVGNHTLEKGINLWTVLFFAKLEPDEEWHIHYELMDLKDPEATVKIMRTIEAAVTLFIENYHRDIEAISFSANTDDHGRNALYARYTKMLVKQLGWKSLIGLDIFQSTRVFIAYDEEALKAL